MSMSSRSSNSPATCSAVAVSSRLSSRVISSSRLVGNRQDRLNLLRREPLKHDRVSASRLRNPGMTVCTASMFVWSYGPEDFGTAIVAASDKMLTDEGLGIEYQGSRGKWAAFDKRLLVLVAGEMVIHSAVIERLFIELKDVTIPTTLGLSELVAKELREYRTQEAVRLHLSPLNLDEDSFLAQQRTMDSNLVL